MELRLVFLPTLGLSEAMKTLKLTTLGFKPSYR